MIVARSIAELSRHRPELAGTVALVPTMGALHAGHRSLVELARLHADSVMVSIFVNPLQFGAGEDFGAYPRPIEDDLETCDSLGVDLVFAPTAADLIGSDPQVGVSAGRLGTVLEGASRPGHFDGVLTVVAKLINLTRPGLSVFGRKDAQQLACIQAMSRDLNLGTEVVGAPIVREEDGLALSSRNVYLNDGERGSALALSRALGAAGRAIDPESALAAARSEITGAETAHPWVERDYVELVEPSTFLPLPADHRGPALLALAVRVGRTRLIDNQLLDFG